MLTRTGLAVLTDALKLIGVVAGHEVPTSAEQTDSFARLNELIDSWGTHAQTLLVPRRDVVPLVIGQQTYTIAPVGADLVLPVPITIDAVSVLLASTPPTEVFLDLGTDQAYIGQAQKTLRGTPPLAAAYTRTHAGGELWVWPVPSAASSLVLYWHEPLAQFPDLVTPVSLAAGYAKALRTNLAIELAPEFGRPVDPLVLRLAAESLADIKRANVALVEIGVDAGLTGGPGGYNILTDT
jgi:hypothetical protein